jgi:hypothetical protein
MFYIADMNFSTFCTAGSHILSKVYSPLFLIYEYNHQLRNEQINNKAASRYCSVVVLATHTYIWNDCCLFLCVCQTAVKYIHTEHHYTLLATREMCTKHIQDLLHEQYHHSTMVAVTISTETNTKLTRVNSQFSESKVMGWVDTGALGIKSCPDHARLWVYFVFYYASQCYSPPVWELRHGIGLK